MFLLIYLLGLSLLYLLSKEFKLTERLALAMPLGLGLTTFLMFLLDRSIHSITPGTVMAAVAICAILLALPRFVAAIRSGAMPWQGLKIKLDFSWLTLPWAVLAGMTAYLVNGITVKCLYWPPAEFDTIEGYDLLSKAVAHEHIIANSILTNKEMVVGCGPRLLYPPLLALANSLCYMTGMETPKLINALFFVSWAFILYLLLRRFVSPLNAMLFTFFSIIAPEMFAHASFSLTNLPCAIYSTIAVASFAIWFEKRIDGFFYLSFIAIIFSIWTRSEAFLFVLPILLVLAYVAIREKKFIYPAIYLTSIIPFLVWNSFLKAYVPRAQTEFFIKKAFYDPHKLAEVLHTAWGMMTRSDLYGLTFYILLAGLLLAMAVNIATNFSKNRIILGGLIFWLVVALAGGISLFNIVLFAVLVIASDYINDGRWALSLIFFMALGAYTAIFYQISDADGSLFSPGGWMQSGYKRGLFNYVPLAFMLVATGKWVSLVLGMADEKMMLFQKPV